MGSRRTLILVAAIAIGAVAAFLVWNYVGGIQNKAYGNAAKVSVYVVKKEVTKGQYGQEAQSEGLIVKTEIPKQFYPSNAVRDIGTDITGKVAINDIPVNQIVTTDMFADPLSVQTTFANRLERIRGQDQTAITISVDNIHGVAGLLQPGDYVNIMASTTCTSATTTTSDTGSSTTSGGSSSSSTAGTNNPCQPNTNAQWYFPSATRYIYQKVQILAVDQTPVAQPGDVQAASSGSGSSSTATPAPANQDRGLLTLIVPARAAQYIASLSSSAIYLTLVSRDYKPVPMTPIDGTKPLPAEDPTVLTPYGPAGAGK